MIHQVELHIAKVGHCNMKFKGETNKSVFLQDLEELDPDFIMAKQVEQLEKEKRELQERLKNQEKKVTG